MKGVQCYELFGGIALKIHTFSFFFHFFPYSVTASNGSEESTAGCVVSPCSIMMHHGLRSKEARCA